MKSRALFGVLLAALAVSAGAAWFFWPSQGADEGPRSDGTESSTTEPSSGPDGPARAGDRAKPPDAPPEYVGSTNCSGCHRAQAELYSSSHHRRALREPDARDRARLRSALPHTDLGGALEDASTPEQLRLRLDQAGKSRGEFDVVYVAGVAPLEQYVVHAGRGRLQSLGDAYQTESEGDGKANGWLHVYGPKGIAAGQPLHGLSPAQNWNHVCADCHSTHVERRYDEKADGFASVWSELSVGCEACHGPGSRHVDWMKRGYRKEGSGLLARQQRSAPWVRPPGKTSPEHHAVDDAELGSCGPCHSRRETLAEGFTADQPFLDHFEPELLRPGRYQADGQVEGEVYEWGSFLQSKMHAAGVRCSDCHEPHSGKLRASGDALCTSCHESAAFASPAHTHHPPGAAACVDCHMPSHTFMQVDHRRDHSIRVPRPDLSLRFGVGNACESCHAERPKDWAHRQQSAWFPGYAERPHFGVALALERAGQEGALDALLELAADEAAPAIARATALEALGGHPGARTRSLLTKLAYSDEPLLALGVARAAAALPGTERFELLIPMLSHPRLSVRVVVGKALGDAPLAELGPEARAALAHVWPEVERSFDVAAVLPATQVERAAFELRRGRLDASKAALKLALGREPCSVAAWLNLAELARASEDEDAAHKALDKALGCGPDDPDAHYAAALGAARRKDTARAQLEFERASALSPDNTRVALGLAALLESRNQLAAARRVIERALERRREDVALWAALASYQARTGDAAGAERSEARRRHLLR